MSEASTDTLIRRAIGGDREAIGRIVETAEGSGQAVAMAMAAVLADDPARLAPARLAAGTSRDRQIVEIATAALQGDRDRVDALARDHLVDHPDSLIGAWLAAEVGRPRPGDPRP
jgi:hypothetical protein